MIDPVPLDPPGFAALVAPAVDRLVVGTAATGWERGGAALSQRYGGPAATGFLMEFRTRLAAPGGTVSAPGFAAVTRHRDPVRCQRGLDKQVAYAMIHRTTEGGLQATERGRTYLAEVYELHARITGELWEQRHGGRVARLVDVLGVLVTEAARDGGDAFGALAPPYEPDGCPPGVLLLNRLSVLRQHRADAHAAAWTAAGHTRLTIADLPPGPERLAIEQETDRRSAAPYAALAPEARLRLLADLAALPT
ncbi:MULTISPECIES: hypothetical protein [Polymorphospora]|uniref:Uncharacterized protein n=1 Tax=Polymorphospora lycopeni TaxID=3140240 RepID=A0ABV5CPQ7_9ACTN